MFVAGLVACQVFGIGNTLERTGSWASPAMIAGAVLGIAILALTVAFATGFRPQFLPTDVSMLIALGVLIGSKVVVSLVSAST
jgi:hypothetical protein